MSGKKNKEPKFNETQAYEELRLIIARAIETQDFASLEPNIAIWESKYPLADFLDMDIIRKIKVILNKDYLSRLIGAYLASQILHEQQKQQEAYDSLKQIIETAKKTKDYKSAKKTIAKWKTSLYDNGLSLYDFNRFYKKRIFTMLLLPSNELTKQSAASKSLQEIIAKSNKIKSTELSNELSSWQSKYLLDSFPDNLKKELNSITADVLKSISIKSSEEEALHELQEYVNSEKKNSPTEEIPTLLSKYDYKTFSDDVKSQINSLTLEAMDLTLRNDELINESPIVVDIPPSQQAAIYDLQNIFSKDNNNQDALFNWIYLYRKMDFVPTAKNEIKSAFRKAGFPKPTKSFYSIPSFQTNINDLKDADIAKIKEKVILSYLGILYMDNKSLSANEGNTVSAIYDTAITMLPPVEEDTTSLTTDTNIGKDSSLPDDIISIEDLLKDPLDSYDLSSPNLIEDEAKSENTNNISILPLKPALKKSDTEVPNESHVLSQKDQQAIEDINYSITTRNIISINEKKGPINPNPRIIA